MRRQYPQDFTDRAVRLVNESKENYETEWAAIWVAAVRLNLSAETLRKWMLVSGLGFPLLIRQRFAA